ncbi:TetR/AcrR family transcriptional regulator [Actinoplanes sp. TBRC 11911]|uniref:TetR/AcrR family transcriptional regulator n=1 Tax=Actinoplanes sp. TBRC 11911 TaxID=2729386 RepID=UPI00145D34D8|nr:TetR/AcrR family transcriptional regulator [Actinoplanes sp. TBRC 11911]NMO51180.1 TetR/AcrR family transcriptional regulator [Actinoplanes sp. TBRC 11911]
MNQASKPPSRRAEYAELTRRAIVDAARRLFAERGFFATRVDEIAAEARVSPATVYAVSGGKQGLMGTLIDEWTRAPIIAEYEERFARLEDPAEILRTLSFMTRTMRQDWGDVMRLALATAPHDQAVAADFALGTKRYRDGVGLVARRLADLGALATDVDADEAADVLWYYFGYASLFTLVDDNHWTYDRAERWLARAASDALLRK